MKPILKIGIFFVLAMFLTIVLAIFQQASGIKPEMISLPQFGPGLAAISMVLIFKSDNIKFKFTLKGVHLLNIVGVIAIPIIVPILLFILYNRFINPISVPPISPGSFAILLVGILLGAFGEELGWRGYAQQFLERSHNRLTAFLVIGFLWGIWHIGNFQNGLLFMLFFVFSTIGYSGVMAWLLRGTQINLILATLFHFSVNVGFYLLQDAINDLRLVALNGLVWVVAAGIIVTLNKEYFLQTNRRI